MRIKQFVGTVGGRPNLAYYMVGSTYTQNQTSGRKQGQGLIYLDPHFIQAKSSASVDEYQTDPDQFHYG